MTTLTISLPESLRDFVNHQVRNGGYGNVSEYFRGLLREAQAREADEGLERLLLESLGDPGSGIEVTPQYWKKLKKRIQQRIGVKKRAHRR